MLADSELFQDSEARKRGRATRKGKESACPRAFVTPSPTETTVPDALLPSTCAGCQLNEEVS